MCQTLPISYVYGSKYSSRSDLKFCYESCTKAEEIRERAFDRYRSVPYPNLELPDPPCPNDCEDK